MLKRWMNDMSPSVALAIVLFLIGLGTLLELSIQPSDSVNTTQSYNQFAANLFWIIVSAIGAVGAAIFTGALAYFAFAQVRDSRLNAEHQLRAYLEPIAIIKKFSLTQPIEIVA